MCDTCSTCKYVDLDADEYPCSNCSVMEREDLWKAEEDEDAGS